MGDNERSTIQMMLQQLLDGQAEMTAERRACRAHCDTEMPRVYSRINEVKRETDATVKKMLEGFGKLCGQHSAREKSRELLPHWSHVVILLMSIGAAYFYGKGLH